MTLLITNVYQSDGVYYLTVNGDETAVFTRTPEVDILGLQQWSNIFADLIDAHGTSLEGKSLVITSTSIGIIAELV